MWKHTNRTAPGMSSLPWFRVRHSVVCLLCLLFFAISIPYAASEQLPKTQYLGKLPQTGLLPPEDLWLLRLVTLITHIGTEDVLTSKQDAEQARQFLTIVDIPEAIHPGFTQTRSEVLLTSSSKSLCCALLLLDQANQKKEPANGPNRTKVKDLLSKMTPKFSESKNAQDRLAASYADLLLAQVSGSGALPYSETDLLRITRQYKRLYPERAMMAQFDLGQLYASQGKPKDARAAYKVLLQEYRQFEHRSVYEAALWYVEMK